MEINIKSSAIASKAGSESKPETQKVNQAEWIETEITELMKLVEMQDQILKIMAARLERIASNLQIKKLESKPTNFVARPTFTLRPCLLRILESLTKAKEWVTPEQIAESTDLSSNLVRYRYLPELHHMGFVLRTLISNRTRGKRKYLYKLKPEAIPGEIKSLILYSSFSGPMEKSEGLFYALKF